MSCNHAQIARALPKTGHISCAAASVPYDQADNGDDDEHDEHDEEDGDVVGDHCRGRADGRAKTSCREDVRMRVMRRSSDGVVEAGEHDS